MVTSIWLQDETGWFVECERKPRERVLFASARRAKKKQQEMTQLEQLWDK